MVQVSPLQTRSSSLPGMPAGEASSGARSWMVRSTRARTRAVRPGRRRAENLEARLPADTRVDETVHAVVLRALQRTDGTIVEEGAAVDAEDVHDVALHARLAGADVLCVGGVEEEGCGDRAHV